MRYLGEKSRIAKDISAILNQYTKDKPFVSLFCGSCAIESKVETDTKILNDAHPYLIALYKSLQNGYELPDSISREQYYWVKEHKENDPALTGFVGFGCSFGGKWFGGYASNRGGTNYAEQSKRSMLHVFDGIANAEFYNLDYRAVPIPDNAVIYCDPPYRNTTVYTTGAFDSNAFWDYVRKLSTTHVVFVSEEKAPPDFTCIWEKNFTRTLDRNKSNQPTKVERLFVKL